MGLLFTNAKGAFTVESASGNTGLGAGRGATRAGQALARPPRPALGGTRRLDTCFCQHASPSLAVRKEQDKRRGWDAPQDACGL